MTTQLMHLVIESKLTSFDTEQKNKLVKNSFSIDNLVDQKLLKNTKQVTFDVKPAKADRILLLVGRRKRNTYSQTKRSNL